MSELNLKGKNDSVIERCDYTKFRFIIYPDDTTLDYNEVINRLNGLCADYKNNYIVGWVTHDKDTNDSGLLIKPHTHVVIKLRTGHKTPSAMRKTLALPDGYYMKTYDDLGKSLGYLIHYKVREGDE